MNNKGEFITLHRVFLLLAFLVVFIAHAMTVSPSVPFWDCAERLTAITWQQNQHPPGAPLFSMLGRVFQLIIPFGDLGWRGNMLAVTASAGSVAIFYLIIVMVINNFRKEGIKTLADALTVYGSAFIGAIAFGLSGTFWFVSVEAESDTTILFLTVLIMWLMMRWTQVADEPGNERYIITSLYLMGISMGLHQAVLLVMFTMILLIYFRKYETTFKSFTIMSVVSVVLFYIIFMVIVISLPAFLAGRSAARNEALEYTIYNSTALSAITVLGIGGVAYLFWWSLKKKKSMMALSTFGFLLVIFSYTIYAHVLIRANANPPMNQNEPKNFSALASYVAREQYGKAPMWPRRYQTEDYYVQYHNKKDDNGNYVYGVWNPPGRKPVQRKDGTTIAGTDWNNINTAGELAYLWKYQANHMYFRYFLWNFVGRKSDVQDAGVAWFDKKDTDNLNYKTGVEDVFPVQFYALPLLFGLLGLYFHFKRDPKMAFVWLGTFIIMGVLTALYQNQQEPQPRERDYFYVASFMIWGMWIGLGVYSIIVSLAKKEKTSMLVTASVLAVSTLLVPVNLAIGGAKIYSRAGNYLPFDYAYNILQSVEQDAIVFTNGDNDTFPVWYVQDVAGVRRDVRICNLSLGNTLWYVDALKNREPWGAKKVPLSFSDDSLQVTDELDDRALSYDFGEAQNVTIPVKSEIIAQYTDDKSIIESGKVEFTFLGRPYSKDDQGRQIYLFRVQDKLVMDIIKQTKFERPVYYSVSVGGDAFCGLEKYFRQEGLCMRICPTPQYGEMGNTVYNDKVMDEVLMNVDNSNEYSKTQKYGLKLRNLNDNGVYYDDVHRRSMQVYRQIYIAYANYLVQVKKDKAKAMKIIDIMRQNISDDQFPMHFEMEYRLAFLFEQAENKELMEKYARMGIKSCEEVINNENLRPETIYYEQMGHSYGPHNYAADMYKMLGEYDAAKATIEKLLQTVTAIKQQFEAGGESAMNSQDYRRIISNYGSLKTDIRLLEVDKLEAADKKEEALEKAKNILHEMQNDTTEPMLRFFTSGVESKINQLEVKLGIRNPSDTLQQFVLN